jgi:alkylation response protein AidB-like acyl-CoA dehydrogenase
LTEEPQQTLRTLLETVILPIHHDRWGGSDAWVACVDFQRQLGSHGWTAPGWPVEIGGLGLSIEQQVACEGVYFDLGAPRRVSVYGVNNVGPTIAAHGTPAQKRHLQAIVDVDEVWCQGFSEPDAGSDLASLRTRADRMDDGFTINGQKIWTSIGLNATHCLLLARTDPEAPKHQGISAFLVPLDLPGITRRPIRQINGEEEFAELFFDDVKVPATSVLGPIDRGWQVTMTTLGYERAGVLSISGQLAIEAETTVRDLARRGELGGPRLDRAMRIFVRAQLLRTSGERALSAEAGTPGPLSTVIKLAWSSLATDVAEFLVDTRGFEVVAGADPTVSERFLRSRALTIAGGTTEVLKNLVAERVLGLPKDPTR